MNNEYKHWKYIGKSPAGADKYKHITREVLLYVYQSPIKIFRDFDPEYPMLPVYAKEKLEKFKTT